LQAIANGIGVSVVLRFGGTSVAASIGVPLARARVTTTRPEASIDRFGLASLYVQPVRLGWRWPRAELVTGYAFYAPTSHSEPGGAGALANPQWTHEFSLGGAACFDDARTWRISALASYERNQRKERVDITRGDTVQIQGGAGTTFAHFVDVGLAAYALWQVHDDSGTALPPVLLGARDRTFGVGPELGVRLPAIRSRLTARYAHDFGARSRPEGWIFTVAFVFAAWLPDAKDEGGT
jgi:hypothetical protein